MDNDNEPQQAGAVIIFKPGVTAEQAAKALEAISSLIELPDPTSKWLPKNRVGQSPVRLLVNEFNPNIGCPCWYIP